jgi:hypothetical protein
MQTHGQVDERSLALARAVARKIDADPNHEGLLRARAVCARWMEREPSEACAEWIELLADSWPAVRDVLLDPSDRGQRLRQSSPFCGILTPAERWAIYRTLADHAT